MPTKPNLTAAITADAYRATHPAPTTPAVRGRHLVEPGQQATYWGLDQTLWGQQVTVLSLCPLDYRCRIELAAGWTLTQVDEHGLIGGAR